MKLQPSVIKAMTHFFPGNKMKCKARVFDNEYLLDPAQLDKLLELIDGCEILDEEHVGKGLGTRGWDNAYIGVLKSPTSASPKLEVMSNSDYEALKAVTKMREATKETT